MMHSCILCTNTSQKTFDRPITYHSFPQNPLRRNRWLQSLNLTSCTNWHRICSDHFNPTDFRPGEKRMLWPFVVPKLRLGAQTNKIYENNTTQVTTMNEPQTSNLGAQTNETNDNYTTQVTTTNESQSLNLDTQTNETNGNNTTQVTTTNEPQHFNIVAQTNEANDNDTTQVVTMNKSQYLKESDNSDTNNITMNTSVAQCNLIRRSSRKVKPVTLSDDSTYTLNSSSITSDEEEKANNNKTIKKKKNKEVVANGMRCSVKNCNNRYPTPNLSFFGYPNDINTRKIWIKNCGIEHLVGVDFTVKSSLKVCGCHFENNMFLNFIKKNRLAANAVPTIFYDKNTSEILYPENESTENIENLSTNNDSSIIKTLDSSNLLNTKEKYACCLPGCIYSNDNINENVNTKRKAFALFSPHTIEIVNKWMSILELPLTVNSTICERHFKPEDVLTRELFSTQFGLAKEKKLNDNAVPIKGKKYGGLLKRSRVNNFKEDKYSKKPRKNADETKAVSNLVNLPKDKTIEIIASESPTSILNGRNATLNLNNESVDSLSSITSTISTGNNSQPSYQHILPKILANNSLSISIQPNVQHSKLVPVTTTTVANVTNGLNQSEKPVETVSITSPNNSNLGQLISKKLNNNSSLSISVEKNNYQSAQKLPTQSTEVVQPKHEIKSEPIDDVPQTISTDDSISVQFPSRINLEQSLCNTPVNNSATISTHLNISKTKKIPIPPGIEIIGLTILNTTVDIKPEIIDYDDEPEITNDSLQSIDVQKNLNTLVDNSLPLNSSIAQNEHVSIQPAKKIDSNSSVKSEPFDNVLQTSSNDSQTNFEQQHPNSSSSILLNVLQSGSSAGKTPTNNSISNTHYSKCIQNDHLGMINNKTTFKTNSSNNESREILDNTSDQVISSPFVESSAVKDFLCDSKNALLPNQFWISFYNPSKNAAAFIQRDESMCPIKRVYFYNSFVPKIFINRKPYDYKGAIKSINDLENLLEDIDDIMLCSGYDGYAHEACIGYFENTSDEIEVCRNCQNFIKNRFLQKMDNAIKTKSNTIIQLKKQIPELKMKIKNAKKRMLQKNRNENHRLD